ncbi:MAG: hypothetical protein JNM70_08015 [Anaerolineae bacterium]|nr:hypothetical protein [Anaerolineae bacterium]
MAETSLVKKLLIKPGNRLLILNAPDGYPALLGELPEGVTIDTAPSSLYDQVQVFAYHKADLDTRAVAAIQSVKPGGILWIMYPKKSGAIKTDISRDVGWEKVVAAGYEGVTQIAIDATWSALRFRPFSEIKVLTREKYRK